LYEHSLNPIAHARGRGILLTSPASQAGPYLSTLIGINLLSNGIASAAAGLSLRRSRIA
jgi:uncharacterized membrane protein HdeD (DUF308 family)